MSFVQTVAEIIQNSESGHIKIRSSRKRVSVSSGLGDINRVAGAGNRNGWRLRMGSRSCKENCQANQSETRSRNFQLSVLFSREISLAATRERER